MKKILLVFDGRRFSDGVFEFVKNLNHQQNVFATGVFLASIDYAEFLRAYGGLGWAAVAEASIEMDEMKIDENMGHFMKLCRENNIEHRAIRGYEDHIIEQIKMESRFADLMVISSELFYNTTTHEPGEDYLGEVLHKTECPVVLVPEKYNMPANIILAYDGGEQSVFAIKQFAYLFPEFKNL